MAELLEELVEKVAPLVRPVSEQSPPGEDASYDPAFEKVKAEVDKLSSMSEALPNWPEVIEGCAGLLRTKTKDLRLLAWLTVARMRRDGLAGLAEGLASVQQVCAAHWDGMFPPARRARARANVASWLGDQATDFLSQHVVTAQDAAPLRAVHDLHNQLDDTFADKLGELYTGMGSLRRLLRDKLRELPPEQPAQPAPPASAEPSGAASPTVAAAPAQAPPAAVPPAAAPAMAPLAAPTIAGEQDVVRALRTLGKSVLEAAAVLRRADPAQAWAYTLQRTGAWLAIKQPPPNEGGASRIAPPGADETKRIESLQSAARWLELLMEAEQLAGQHLFWLDAHRYSSVAMDQLGALFLPAREALVRAVLEFLAKFPGIEGLSFSDGTPFADAATRAWLEAEQQKAGAGSGAAAGSSAVSEEEAELAQRFQEAKEMVASGKVADGLALAIQLASRGADGRTRFRARLAVGRMALQAGHPEVARPLLQSLAEEADRHALDSWEPQLSVLLYTALLESLRPKGKAALTDELASLQRGLHDRLCQLDPAAGLKLAGL